MRLDDCLSVCMVPGATLMPINLVPPDGSRRGSPEHSWDNRRSGRSRVVQKQGQFLSRRRSIYGSKRGSALKKSNQLYAGSRKWFSLRIAFQNQINRRQRESCGPMPLHPAVLEPIRRIQWLLEWYRTVLGSPVITWSNQTLGSSGSSKKRYAAAPVNS